MADRRRGLMLINDIKKIMGMLLCCFFIVVSTFDVMADEKNEEGCKEFTGITSDLIYDEYQLGWEFNSESLYDLLSDIYIGDICIAQYRYNESFLRTHKETAEVDVTFAYTAYGQYDTIWEGNQCLKYIYFYDMNTNIEYIRGFEYNSLEYEFEYVDNVIVGIKYNDELIAKYIYGDSFSFIETQIFSDGQWIRCEDDNFIGNINKIRYVQVYYDEETGWYYMGRYYDPYNVRYVDGLSPETAEELMKDYGYRAVVKSYQFALPYTGIMAADIQSAKMSEFEVVGRVIYCEAGKISYDWHAVAWVIFNRMNAYGKTAYEVVTYEDAFSAYVNRVYLNVTIDSTQEKWKVCMENAYNLVINSKAPSTSVTYITTQKNFRSINTFINGYTGSDCQRYLGDEIMDVAVPGIANITLSTDINSFSAAAAENQFNIYFNFIDE